MERYLNKCLDSLIVDNMNLLEVLVINDGSKDNSSKIAHEYALKYPTTFRVIDKENGNYGSCINEGLKEAKGKYIKVLDADDSFENSYFNEYLYSIKDLDVDLILTDYAIVDENNKIQNIFSHNLKIDKILNFRDLCANENCDFSIQMHAVTYKRENLLLINYHQTEGISYTDQEWVFLPMTTVKTVVYKNKVLYKYLVGREGQTVEKSVMKKQSKQLGIVISSLLDKFDNNIEHSYDNYFVNQLQVQMFIYPKALIEESFDIETLISLDKEIKEKCFKLYQLTNNISSCKIKYVSYWRKHNYKSLPYLIKKIIALKNIY